MLTYYISVWYAGCSAVDIKALRGVVKSAVKILIPHFVHFVFIFIYIFTFFIVFILHPVILLLHQTELRLQFGCMLSLQWQQGHSDSVIVPLNICLSIYIKTPRLTAFIAQSDIPEVDIAHSQRLQPRILLELSFNRCVQSLSAPTHSHHCFQLQAVLCHHWLTTKDSRHNQFWPGLYAPAVSPFWEIILIPVQ